MPSFPFLTISLSLVKLMSVASVMLSSHLILCLSLPSFFLSIKVFSNESAHYIRQSKYWSFSVNLSNEYSGLIFFKIEQILESSAQQHTLKGLVS